MSKSDIHINTMTIKILIHLILFAFTLETKVPLFDRAISERIFTNHEIMMIFVYPEEKSHLFDVIEKICEDTLDCCQITKKSSFYSQITSFIGYPSQTYVAIIDTNERLKYVLPLNDQKQVQLQEKIFKFRQQYYKKELQPFFASEKQLSKPQINQSCLKLVGSNYADFLSEEVPLKIVFLYSSDSICQNCKSLLNNFCQLAQKHQEDNLILFGYFDVTKNDNRFIKDQIFPYFLIYVYDNFEDPFGVQAQQINELEGYVRQLKKDVRRATQQIIEYDQQLDEL